MEFKNYRKNLFELETLKKILERMDKLTPASQRLWGKMTVDKMLVHCTRALQAAMGITKPNRSWLSYTIGPLFKSIYTNEKPFSKNTPTDANFVVADAQNFEQGKANLKKLLTKFNEGGPKNVTKNAHPFFGKLTPAQWSRGQYKHIDHHFGQFGV